MLRPIDQERREKITFSKLIQIVLHFTSTKLEGLAEDFHVSRTSMSYYANAHTIPDGNSTLRFFRKYNFNINQYLDWIEGNKQLSLKDLRHRLEPISLPTYNPTILFTPIVSDDKLQWSLKQKRFLIPRKAKIDPTANPYKEWLKADYLLIYDPEDHQVARMYRVDRENLDNEPFTKQELMGEKDRYPALTHDMYLVFPFFPTPIDVWDTNWTAVFSGEKAPTSQTFILTLSELFNVIQAQSKLGSMSDAADETGLGVR